SEYIAKELDRIYFRTFLCLLVLLVFVFLVSRSWRYLFVIALTLVADILAAIVLYNLLDITVHIYTLAGITVSLGIMIDTAIVMADHYSYCRNRSVFPALLGATGTTVGALCVILLLPEQDRKNLTDFAWIIMVNLSVSLITAYLFIPSLIDRYPLRRSAYSLSLKRRRRIIRWNRRYQAFIEACLRRRWVLAVVLVASFGIPTCLLPEKLGSRNPDRMQKVYNGIMGWPPYADNRKDVDGILGTSFAMFSKAMDRSDFYREPGRQSLQIDAAMPEGCTVGQLNEVVRSMENYLCKFGQIEMFTTDVKSYDNASISVSFRPEYENTSFPAELKSQVISMANNFGGATWRVYGVNNNYFSNNVRSDYKSYTISLKGYNYDELVSYADTLMDILSVNRRVSELEFVTPSGRLPVNEYNMEYDFGKMSVSGVNPYRYYQKLSTVLYQRNLVSVVEDGEMTSVVLKSSESENFDYWHVVNSQVRVDSTYARLSELGSVEKRRTGFPIVRNNQSYEVK
ncbi:MAG: efflux RND transporter permease subunit, partial [Bacteroidales bacterium]|nr:efflux RND transporter permease subunit [Bacteroidales bacterium]